jgi:hypothetical protein
MVPTMQQGARSWFDISQFDKQTTLLNTYIHTYWLGM